PRCKKLAFKEVPCSVQRLNDREAFFVAVAENMQREQMGPYDVALAVLRATEEMGLLPEDVARELRRETKEIHSWLVIARNPKLMDHLERANSTLGIALALGRAWTEVEELRGRGDIESDQVARLQRDFLAESKRRSVRDFERLTRKTLDPLMRGRSRQTALAEADSEQSPHQQAVEP
ncbi:Chromosome (plasmid) partitioning protein ParB / Stage 0 sporulation protein, partial [mine drainage metagenome]